MADYLVVGGKVVTLPPECETDMAARAAFIDTKLAAKPAKKEKE